MESEDDDITTLGRVVAIVGTIAQCTCGQQFILVGGNLRIVSRKLISAE